MLIICIHFHSVCPSLSFSLCMSRSFSFFHPLALSPSFLCICVIQRKPNPVKQCFVWILQGSWPSRSHWRSYSIWTFPWITQKSPKKCYASMWLHLFRCVSAWLVCGSVCHIGVRSKRKNAADLPTWASGNYLFSQAETGRVWEEEGEWAIDSEGGRQTGGLGSDPEGKLQIYFGSEKNNREGEDGGKSEQWGTREEGQ